jgi:hypothetical protein
MLLHNVGAVSAPGHTKCDAHRFVPCAVITRERKRVQRETVAGFFLVRGMSEANRGVNPPHAVLSLARHRKGEGVWGKRRAPSGAKRPPRSGATTHIHDDIIAKLHHEYH